MNPKACVCIPARNEVDRITTLLEALASQEVAQPFAIAICVNNSGDGTAHIARSAASRIIDTVAVAIREITFEEELAHAGSARRAAMDLGAELLGDEDGLLISTDADCRPPHDWISANLAAARPDRIVGGRIELDEDEAPHSPEIFALRRRFDDYWRQVRAIEDSIDVLPWDPAPRHGDHTGASLALSVSLYARAGGVPLIPVGEDRALVDAAIGVGGTLVHPLSVWTRTSARTVGRALGGMAGELQGWIETTSRGDVPTVPHFDHWKARATWRRKFREARGVEGIGEAERLLPPMPCDMPLPGESGQ